MILFRLNGRELPEDKLGGSKQSDRLARNELQKGPGQQAQSTSLLPSLPIEFRKSAIDVGAVAEAVVGEHPFANQCHSGNAVCQRMITGKKQSGPVFIF